jgi:L-lactate dehydrogenase complex protein LldG
MQEQSSNGRAGMLARISSALGRRDVARPAPLLPFALNVPKPDREELIARFILEVENAGGSVAQVNSRFEVQAYLKTVLGSAAQPVALSDGATLRGLGIGEWLKSSGFRVLGTLKQFAAGNGADFEQYKQRLFEAEVGITSASYGLADTGTLVLLSRSEQLRLISLLPPIHVCILEPRQILWSLSELLAHEQHKFLTSESQHQTMTCITGPSRTADIEQTITMGVHGPHSLHVLLYSL